MIRKIKDYLIDMRAYSKINQSLIKGQIMSSNRHIDLTNPLTWEFSGFSQNGEDGILEILRKQLLKRIFPRNRFFRWSRK